ncbi:UNVERIFIED_CONTAM: hypothetical protein FKN15_058103 [Acipenser sinensis]
MSSSTVTAGQTRDEIPLSSSTITAEQTRDEIPLTSSTITAEQTLDHNLMKLSFCLAAYDLALPICLSEVPTHNI